MPPAGLNLNLRYFLHQVKGASMTWDAGAAPDGFGLFSGDGAAFGAPAPPGGADNRTGMSNIAASLQQMYEEAFFHLLNHVYQQVKIPNLCLAGGCAMNSVANGKIFHRTPFKEVYIQAAAGDAGGAIGAAFYVWNQTLQRPRSCVMAQRLLGPAIQRGGIV